MKAKIWINGEYNGEHETVLTETALNALPTASPDYIQLTEELSVSFPIKVTPEFMVWVKGLPVLPDSCPSCQFTHPSALWLKSDQTYKCANCHIALPESDGVPVILE